MSESKWIELPEGLLGEAGKLLVGEDSANRSLIEGLLEYLTETYEGCDHSVNICECGTAAVIEGLQLALDGKKTCSNCSGDGFISDEEDDYNQASCPVCSGSGVVEKEKV